MPGKGMKAKHIFLVINHKIIPLISGRSSSLAHSSQRSHMTSFGIKGEAPSWAHLRPLATPSSRRWAHGKGGRPRTIL